MKGEPRIHAGRPALRRRGGRGARLRSSSAPKGRWRRGGRSLGGPRDRFRQDRRRTTWHCWPTCPSWSGRRTRPAAPGWSSAPAASASSGAGRQPGAAAPAPAADRVEGSLATAAARLASGSGWCACTTWRPRCRCALVCMVQPHEGKVGGRDPAPQLHVGHPGPPGRQRAARGASRPTTGGCAARRRSSGSGSRVSAGSSPCCRRRTTWPRTTKRAWPGRTTPGALRRPGPCWPSASRISTTRWPRACASSSTRTSWATA